MNKWLITFSGNWADEMDVEGFKVMTSEEWAAIQTACQLHTKPIEFGVGTNEQIDYEDGNDLLGAFEAHSLTDEEAATIEKFFGGKYGYGFFPDVHDCIEQSEENEE